MSSIDLGDGEIFAVADRMILVRETESVIAIGAKLGADEAHVFYSLTFKGRINNSTELDSVTVCLDPHDAFELASQIIDGIGLLVKDND